MKIWLVDAFTNKPYGGNPAGVMIVDEFPPDSTCLKIAAEINLSETAFVKRLAEDHVHIRWFSPIIEVKLCGHGTLATAHILNQEGLFKGDTLRLESLSGQLFVYKTQDGFSLDFPLQPVAHSLDIQPIQDLLGITIINAVKAIDDIIIELPDETAVRQFNVSAERIMALDGRALIITTKGSGYDFVSRFFAPRVGISEDPVTGSAHCKLADYWQKKLGKSKFLAYQASKRGGEMKLEICDNRVLMTGQAVTVMSGDWLV